MKIKLLLSFICISLTISMFIFIKPPQIPQKQPQITPSPINKESRVEHLMRVYQDPATIQLQKAINNYLAGSTEGINISAATTGNRIINGHQLGLGSFDRSYYKSRFIVLNFERENGSEFTTIDIVFTDKPDRYFRTMLESNNNQYQLISFGELQKLSESQVDQFKETYNYYMNKYVNLKEE